MVAVVKGNCDCVQETLHERFGYFPKTQNVFTFVFCVCSNCPLPIFCSIVEEQLLINNYHNNNIKYPYLQVLVYFDWCLTLTNLTYLYYLNGTAYFKGVEVILQYMALKLTSIQNIYITKASRFFFFSSILLVNKTEPKTILGQQHTVIRNTM